MSHAVSAETAVEPNLTPLLDLVLQLLMFFMITVNFTEGVTNTGETLPYSETVAPLDADGNDPIILSVKPFRIGVSPGEGKEPRDDFRYFGSKERENLRKRFADFETCVLVPTEQLTRSEVDQGRGRDTLIRRVIDMKKKFADLAEAERSRLKLGKTADVPTPIHIRADGEVKTGDIYDLMDYAKAAGFVNIKARALLGTGERK